MLEFGRKRRTGGRMIGLGHSCGNRSGNAQWFRMDWHPRHEDQFDWYDENYHFHTDTIYKGKK